ncbi:hypothetical protein [Spirillospora sp. NPDC029432]|uniref:hypothetical protein n=1 Tax=Spirillospora sp. NPDC029432 TaxID=3154599 RepID=UPI0034561D94
MNPPDRNPARARPRARRGLPILAAGAAVALLAACGGSGDGSDGTGAAAEPVPHGYVEGAEEAGEAQWRLVLAEAGGGRVRALDPATEKVTEIGTVDGLTGIATDGRFAYLATAGGVRIADTGVWTVDHGDHVHYYRARAGVVGDLAGAGADTVAGDAARTALAAPGGVRVLDREALGKGEIRQAASITGRTALPYGERLLVPSGDGGRVAVHDRSGRRVSELPEPCPEPRGQAVTRRGAVLGCADGALLVTGDGGRFAAEKIAYPGTVPAGERAGRFHHRPGAAVLAAAAGDDGAWVLDLAAKEWHRVGSGPAAAVNAVGEDAPVLVLGEDGTLSSYDAETGKRLTSRRLLKDTRNAVIQVDTARAYVNDPAGRAVHEIDYADDLREARTFDLGFAPAHMVETGW